MVAMHDAVGIGLRRPDIVIDRAREGFARGVELEDGDDFTRLRLFDQVVILESPVGGGVGAEASADMGVMTARARAHVEDAHLEDVARLGVFDRNWPGHEMHAQAFAGAADEGAFGRAGAAPRHRLLLARPQEYAFGARIVGDHALVVVVRVMGQRLDGGGVAGVQGQRRGDHFAEISPVNGLGRHGKGVVPHGGNLLHGSLLFWVRRKETDERAPRLMAVAPRRCRRP